MGQRALILLGNLPAGQLIIREGKSSKTWMLGDNNCLLHDDFGVLAVSDHMPDTEPASRIRYINPETGALTTAAYTVFYSQSKSSFQLPCWATRSSSAAFR